MGSDLHSIQDPSLAKEPVFTHLVQVVNLFVCIYIYIAEDCAILRKNDDFSQVVFSEFPDARSLLDVLGSRTFLPATLTETTAAVVQGVRGIGFGLAKRLPVGEESHRLRLAVCM